jgi:amino acid transporter
MTAIPPDEPVRTSEGARAAETRPAGSVPAGSVPSESVSPGFARAGSVPVEERSTLREDVVERERREYGGFKFGSAFFGWLTATGTAVILTALVAATGAAIGLGVTNGDTSNVDDSQAATIGIIGAIALIVVLFVAYFCGGYVAGRMARFDGLRQGLAVWLWAVAIAIVVAIVGAIAGSQFNVLANIDSFPRIPINEGDLTVTGIITAIVVALASLAGALLGGVAGMRFHRKVDRAGLGR